MVTAMPKLQLIGRAWPELLKTDVPAKDINWKDLDGFDANFKLRIAGSLINIECEPFNTYSDNLTLIVMRALDLARAAVNLAEFAIGQGLSVTLDFAIGENGNSSYLIAGNPSLASLCTSYKLTDVSAMMDITLGRALNDLILAISTPHVSPINCGRAIDGIKHITSGNSRDDKKAWKMMRDTLQIDEQYIRFIMTHSTDPRHRRSIRNCSPPVRDECGTRAGAVRTGSIYCRSGAMSV
jgi:hypothetical protein